MRTLFTKAERLLIGNNREFVISSEDSDSQEKSQSSQESFPSRGIDKMSFGPYFDELYEQTGIP